MLGSGEPVAVAAGLLAGALNQNVTAWRSGPAAATTERAVVGWLANAMGCAGSARPRHNEAGGGPRNTALLARVNQRGRIYLSNAVVRGAFGLRACFTNHRTSDADVAAVVDEVRAAAMEV